MNKTALILGIILFCSFGLTGCRKAENVVQNLKPISYEMSTNLQKQGTNVNLVLPPSSTAITGRKLTAYVMLDVEVDNFNYYIVDWGDGTWSYNGPFAYNETYKILGETYHVFKKAGNYSIKAAGVNLASGKLFGWTEPQNLVVTGENFEGEMINNVKPIASSTMSKQTAAKNITDGDNATFWQSNESRADVGEEYIGYLFDKYYTLDSIEIKTLTTATIFPGNLAVEYTTDGGKTWRVLPHYYYVLPNSFVDGQKYNVIMNFPNPAGATLDLQLDNICANGIRVTCKMFPIQSFGVKTFSLSELRVYGSAEMLLGTSVGGEFDAELNNFWTIFGLAQTEPRMYNSLRGGATNHDPFRSGQTMTASVEWSEWNGQKLLWSGYDDAINIHINALKNARYGGDGWYYDTNTNAYRVDTSEYNDDKSEEGFIWATESSPQHLGAQNHYTNNSSLIIASRDYLLTGNNTAKFLESVNAQGQQMYVKLEKAAEYMLGTLGGRSGLMTIYDPRNDGTVHGVSSNYWDSLNCFGYQSAYENILFYRAIEAMVDIENYLGNSEKAQYYSSLTTQIKKKFNETFWDSEKGRYITAINIKGERLDFGFTFVNFMAVSYGLSNVMQAESIYDWVDGKRIIEGEASTGEDIYEFKVSARTNTVAVESKMEDGLHYWWYNGHPFNDVIPGHWGEYGNQMQNGGTIFYTSHYDLKGRLYFDADNAYKRFSTIMGEFHKDELRRDPQTKWGGYKVSIVGEFPESGLVPLTFITGFVGINPDIKGLKISPALPTAWSHASVSEYFYGNRCYSIEVNRKIQKATVTKKGDKYIVKLPANGTYYITLQNKLIVG